MIGECAVNEAVGTNLPNAGWQTLPGSSTDIQTQEYIGQLAWFDQQLMADPRIVVATVFTYDWASRNWLTFDMRQNPPWNEFAAYIAGSPAHTVWGNANLDRWAPLVQYRAAQAGLDPHVVAAVIMLESAGQCEAISSTQATGLMQVEPASVIAGRPTQAVLLNPDQNLKAGCAILQGCLLATASQTNAIGSQPVYNLAQALCSYYGAPDPQSPDGQTYLAAFDAAWEQLWPGVANPVTGAVAPVTPVTPVTPPNGTLPTDVQAQLLTCASGSQCIELNPNAAIQKALVATQGFWPTGPEVSNVVIDGGTFTYQRAEHPVTGEVRVYYCQHDNWAEVDYVKVQKGA